MTELMRQLSDDQLALLGCFGALGFSLLLLSISFHTNPRNRVPVRSGMADQETVRSAPHRDDEQRRAA